MGQEIVSAGGHAITLHTPEGMTASAINTVVIPLVTQTVKSLLRAAHAVSVVRVELDAQRQAKVTYISEYSKVLREDIIPALALAKAHQDGRLAGHMAGLDSDLLGDYLADIERKRQRRRDG